MVFDPRAYSDVRVRGAAGLAGVGFVVDAGHVMTCAHVVADALGIRNFAGVDVAPAASLSLDFPVLQLRGGAMVTRTATVAAWRPMVAGVREDLAILALDSPVPARIEPVRACLTSQLDDRFRAFGVSGVNPEGFIIEGSYAGELAANRHQIKADRADDAPRGGCSGGAAWNVTRGGIIGMVVSRMLERSGEIIPVEVLARAFPIPAAETTDRPPALQPAATRPALILRSELENFDRVPQLSEFGLALDELWRQRKRSVACVIGCRDDDRPDVLLRRFITSRLKGHLEELHIPSDRLRAEQIVWPKQRALKVDRELVRLQSQLRDQLPAAAGADATSLRNAYNASPRPLALYSKIEARFFDDSHEALLAAWLAFWNDFAAGDVNKPLVVFVRCHFDDSAASAHIRRVFEGHCDNIGDSGPRALPELSDFEPSDVVEWLVDKMDELDLGHLRIPAEMSVKARMADKPMRLGGLLAWAETLTLD